MPRTGPRTGPDSDPTQSQEHESAHDGQPALRAAVFLDRDGTLIEERNYPTVPEDIVPFPGTGQALQRLASLGFLRIVLTNQSAVARGMISEEGLADLHGHLVRQLNSQGGGLDAVYYCPHHPDGTAVGYNHSCSCRKPKQGLLDMALNEYSIDLSRSIFIGDCPRDLFLDAGPSAGRLLVQTGHPIEDSTGADAVVPSLVEATEWILERFGRRSIAMSAEPPINPEEMPDAAPAEVVPDSTVAPEAPQAEAEATEEPVDALVEPPVEPPVEPHVEAPVETPVDEPSGDVPHEGGTDESGGPQGQP